MGKLFGGPPKPAPVPLPEPPPPPPPPAALPDEASPLAVAQRKKSAASSSRRTGRLSTILSDAAGEGLGG